MDVLKSMKETLMCCAQGQMGHLETVDAKELGEVIDMIKDLEEAIYYCTITEAMKEKEHNGNGNTTIYYSEPMGYRDMDRMQGRMYFDGDYPTMYNDGGRMYNRMYASNDTSSNDNSTNGRRNYHEGQAPYEMMMRDQREGKSPMHRRMYMESKEMHHDKAKQLKELEKYVQELSKDLIEMIEDASPEEKQYLGNRISSLGTKITKLEHD